MDANPRRPFFTLHLLRCNSYAAAEWAGLGGAQVLRGHSAGHGALKAPEAQVAIVAAVGPYQGRAEEDALYKAATFGAANGFALAIWAMEECLGKAEFHGQSLWRRVLVLLVLNAPRPFVSALRQ